MQTTTITVPVQYVEEIGEFIKSKLQEDIQRLMDIQNSFSVHSVPAVIEKKKEIVQEQKEKPVLVKLRNKKRKANTSHRKGMLSEAETILKNAPTPLTVAEIAFKLENKYGVKTHKERGNLQKSASSILKQYTTGFDRRFDRTKNDKRIFIYTMRNK